MRSGRSFAPALALFAVAAALATPAPAQRRAVGKFPPARIPSTLSIADSAALVAAAARTVLGTPGTTAPECVIALDSDLGGGSGAMFLREARAALAAMPAQARGETYVAHTLNGVRDGDTATVIIKTTSGDAQSFAFNWIEYYFVRGTEANLWRHVASGLAGAEDYAITPGQPKRTPKPCLNGTAR